MGGPRTKIQWQWLGSNPANINESSNLEISRAWEPLDRILRKLTKEKCLHLVFLGETKCSNNRMDDVRRSFHFDCCFVVDSVGLSGGISLLWKDGWSVKVINYT